MPKSLYWDNAYLLLVLNNQDATGIGDVGGLLGSSVAGDVYIAFHTADPTPSGNQSINEVTVGEYNTYARVALARSNSAWTVTSNSASPVADILFPLCTGGTGTTVTHWSIGTQVSGATPMLYSGVVAPNIPILPGIRPRLTNASVIVEV